MDLPPTPVRERHTRELWKKCLFQPNESRASTPSSQMFFWHAIWLAIVEGTRTRWPMQSGLLALIRLVPFESKLARGPWRTTEDARPTIGGKGAVQPKHHHLQASRSSGASPTWARCRPCPHLPHPTHGLATRNLPTRRRAAPAFRNIFSP